MSESTTQDASTTKNIANPSDLVAQETALQSGTQLTRRIFLRNVTVTAASLLAGGCGGGAGGATLTGDKTPAASPGQAPTGNRSPVWTVIPTITFTQGIAASFSVAAFVTDEENDALTITKNAIALPAGVTYDASTKSFVYDGVGGPSSTGGHVLTASEG